MSGEKKYTERDAVRFQRAAYEHGVRRGWKACSGADPEWRGFCGLSEMSAEAYPMPKVTRPRVVEDPHSGFTQCWRAVDGVIEWRDPYVNTDWIPLEPFGFPGNGNFDIRNLTPERINLWSDLLANPTEEVEGDDSETGGGTT